MNIQTLTRTARAQAAAPVAIEGMALAYPPHRHTQTEILDAARAVFAHRPELMSRMACTYANSGVATRNLCMPLAWYSAPHGWPERTQLFEEHALALLETAGRDALAAANVSADAIAATVTVSSTGVATPSLDSLLQVPLGLRPTVQRLPIFGLGCAGGVIGLARACMLARAMPGQAVLFLCTELCSLTFRTGDDSKANIIGTTIFGDGAAAMVLRATNGETEDQPARATVHGWGEHTWPGTRDIMGWRVEDDGLGVVFSPAIPNLVRDMMRPVTDSFLRAHGMCHDDLAGIIAHPGGERVVEALEHCYDLAPGGLADARAVLAERGNMSAVTVLAVLARAIARGARGRHLMVALGPGFSAGMALVDLP